MRSSPKILGRRTNGKLDRRLVILGVALFALNACGIPDDIHQANQAAYASERIAVAAVNELKPGVSRQQLRELRTHYEDALTRARGAREALRGQLEARIAASWLPTDKLAEAAQLNDDLLRCHQKLDERAQVAFRYLEDGRAQDGFRHDVWGLLDPRTCFDELAFSWNELAQ